MFNSTASQRKNDCVVVACSNASGRPYDTIYAELETINKRLNSRDLIGRTGMSHNVLTEWLSVNGWIKQQSIPRRGQDKISGIVRMISTKNVTGHLVYMKNGIVYDIIAPNGMPIKDYQRRTTRKHITAIWFKLSTVIETKSDSFVDWSFLKD